MSEWKKEKIDYAVITYAGGTPNRSRDDYFNGDIPWISSGEVNQSYINKTKEHITLLGLENSSAKWIPQGAVLLAMYGATAGQVAKLKIRATANQAVLALLPNEEIIDKDFLYHLLNIEKDKILFFAQGSGQPNLSKGLIDRYFISFPESPKTQNTIAKILDTCDTVIEQTQSAIAKYKAIKQGMLHDLFTRGLDANDKLRPSYQDAPELYKESELGMIPNDWEVKRISDLIIQNVLDDIQDGNHGEIHPKSNDFVIEGIPFIMASDISKDKLDLENCHRITRDQYLSLRIGFSKSGDILLSHKASIGFVAKVPVHIKEIMLTPQVTYYRVLTESILTSSYLEFFMRSDSFQTQLLIKAKQSTRDYIGITMQKTLIIAFPENINEQIKIANICQSIEQKIFSEEALLRKYQSIKRGLMGDLLSGKKKVV